MTYAATRRDDGREISVTLEAANQAEARLICRQRGLRYDGRVRQPQDGILDALQRCGLV